MSTLVFSTKINASKEKVWEALWSNDNYRKWTSAFMEGSYAESDWKEGSRILFLTPKGDGMFSIIQKKEVPTLMIFKHLGEIKNGVEKPKDWGDATESYRLDEQNGITEVQVDLQMTGSVDMEKYFSETFPKALAILKQIAED